jgi:hypothetical protein
MYLPNEPQFLLLDAANDEFIGEEHKLSRKRPHSACCIAPEAKKRRVVIKSVGFAVSAQIIPAEQFPEDEENINTWYNKKDYETFRCNVKRDVCYMANLFQADQLAQIDFNEYSHLGLEKYICSSQERKENKNLRKQRTQAVLNQQRLQRVVGMNDPETIRMMAEVFAQRAIEHAVARAAALQ